MPKVQVSTKTPTAKTEEGTKKNRVVIYARVSTNKEEQRTSLEFQKQQVKSIEEKGGEVVHIYIDEGVSGRSVKNRKQFQQMLKEAYEDKFDWVYTKNISRFARNLSDMANATRELEQLGKYVYFSEENYSTDNKANKIVLDLLSSIAEQESRNTSEHIRSVIRSKYENGEIVIKSKNPLGYDFVSVKDTETGKTVLSYKPNKEAPIVKDIFQLCIEGYGGQRIANKIYEQYGKEIAKNSIEYILENPVYKGTLVLNRHGKGEELYTIEGNHKPIVSADLWELAQLSRKERKEKNKKFTPNGEHAEWSQKVKCAHCGNYYYVRKLKYGGVYLACSANENRGQWKEHCPNNHLVRADGVEEELKRVYKVLVFDGQTNSSHYTENELEALKKMTDLTANDIEEGLFSYDEYKETQTLSLTLSMGITVSLTTKMGNALFRNANIEIQTGKGAMDKA